MRIILRILVILVVLLSGASLYLGINLFNQREQLKARTNTLEDSLVQLSKFIEAEQDNDRAKRRLPTVDIRKKDIKRYYALDEKGKVKKQADASGRRIPVTDGPGTMKEPLDLLQDKVQNQFKRLDDTRVELQTTRNDLAETQAKLKRTQADLSAAKTKIEMQTEQMSDQDARVTNLEMDLETNEETIRDLNSNIATRDEEINKLKDMKFEMQSKITAQETRIVELQEEKARNQALPQPGAGISSQTLVPGTKGTIRKVNPEWNFVVIDTIPDSKLARNVELLVQRGKKFVGKVIILQVKAEENTAIADIMNEWLQMPIQKGDSVLYVGR